ncbi:MAG: MBL fold metallo-hydrolase [Acidobacteria bacterium]|nr:MAG: MBL fold metallo-hydrolase [Acidobacteriota bacterium]
MLRALAAVAPEAAPPDIAARLEDVNRREQECPRIEVAPGVWLVPLATETLPPATHTNAALVGGRRFVVVDPGSRDAAELEHLLCLVERRVAEGGEVHAVVLTHHHGDHVGGAAAAAARLAVPVLAHPRTVDLLRDEALRGVARGALDDGARLDLDGETLRVVHTPGHAPGHVALVAERARVAIVGDLVSGVSSIVIPPDTGDMGAFLDSLARVAREPVGLVLPGHGPPLAPEALETAREHRLARERAVLDALGAEPRPLEEIARAAYRGERVHERFAAVQTLAHLRHLAARGRARERDGGWQLAG